MIFISNLLIKSQNITIMTKDELIHLAKVGYPKHLHNKIDFNNCQITKSNGYRMLWDGRYCVLKIYMPMEAIESDMISVIGYEPLNKQRVIDEMVNMGIVKPPIRIRYKVIRSALEMALEKIRNIDENLVKLIEERLEFY